MVRRGTQANYTMKVGGYRNKDDRNCGENERGKKFCGLVSVDVW